MRNLFIALYTTAGLLMLGAAAYPSPDAPTRSLSEADAIGICFNQWEDRAYGEYYASYQPISFLDSWAFSTSDTEFIAVVKFSMRGRVERFNCDVYLEGGEIKGTITDPGGLAF